MSCARGEATAESYPSAGRPRATVSPSVTGGGVATRSRAASREDAVSQGRSSSCRGTSVCRVALGGPALSGFLAPVAEGGVASPGCSRQRCLIRCATMCHERIEELAVFSGGW